MTVKGDLAVRGAFLVGTMRTSEANQIRIDDNVTILGTTVANNSLVNGFFALWVQLKHNRPDQGVGRFRQL